MFRRVDYRLHAEEAHHIFVDRLSKREWPAWLTSHQEWLTYDNFAGIPLAEEDIWSRALVPRDIASGEFQTTACDRFNEYHDRMCQLTNATNDQCKAFGRDILDHICNAPGVRYCWGKKWNEPEITLPGGEVPLPVPVQDLIIGLKAFDHSDQENARRELRGLPTIWENDARSLYERAGVQPLITVQHENLIFPSTVCDFKSSFVPLMVSENKAGVSAAKALFVLEFLKDLSGFDAKSRVHILISQGTYWKLQVAFQNPGGYGINMETVWFGDVRNPWCHFQLQMILGRMHQWIHFNHRLEIEDCLRIMRESLALEARMSGASGT